MTKIRWIVDDLTRPTLLKQIESVDLWIDRAVLPFFTEPQDQTTYFDLVKRFRTLKLLAVNCEELQSYQHR